MDSSFCYYSLFRMHFSANTDGKSESGASEDESRSPHQATSLLTELSSLEVRKRRTRASDSLKNLMHELFSASEEADKTIIKNVPCNKKKNKSIKMCSLVSYKN